MWSSAPVFWDWYYTNYLQALIGGDSFNPFVVTMIPPQMKGSNRLQFPAHLSPLCPGPRVPWQIRMDKGEGKKKKKSAKEEWGCLGLSHDFWYDRQTVLLGFNHLRVFWCVCFYCCLTEKAFWKGWITFALFHFWFSSLQLFSVTPSFISYKKKLYLRHYWKTLKNYSAHFSRVQ